MKRIIIKNLSKSFYISVLKNQSLLARIASLPSGKKRQQKLDVLKNISFEASAGEIIGVIGKNGSGKSTLLRIIAGIYKPDYGTVDVHGKIISLIGLRTGLQERLTPEENIYLCASFFGLQQKEIENKLNAIIQFAELENFTTAKIFQFSQGMRQRLVFSIAIHCNPEILLLDEVLAVGDEHFKKKSAQHIKEVAARGGTVLLASNELDEVEKYCDKALLINNGAISALGETREILKQYVH